MFRQSCSNRKTLRAQRLIDEAIAEPLESRRLLAGIEAGVLVARGTAGADVISVRRHLTDDVIVTTNGVDQQFDMDNFTGVRLEGLGGNDTFNLIDPLTSPVVRDTRVLGGAGNDTISYATRTASLRFSIDPAGSQMTSGAQVDTLEEVETLIGGSGGDRFGYTDEDLENEGAPPVSYRLEGRGGDDVFNDGLFEPDNVGGIQLFGGTGNDRFNNDEYGSESFFGESGDDVLNLNNEAYQRQDGGSGIDTIEFGGPTVREVLDLRDFTSFENAEVITGGPHTVIGTDGPNLIDASTRGGVTIQGMGGNDTLIGSDDPDSLVGGAGDDSIDGRAGIDTVDGGPGNDTVTNAEVQPAAPNIRIVNRVLTADGSWGQDRISIERTGVDNVIVRVNDVSREFDIDDFDSVLLRGNAGYDDIRVLDPVRTSAITRSVRLLGGAGNDVLFGSEGGTESLDGGDGVDFLEVRDGFGGDTAIGGNGNDAAQVDPGDTTSGIEDFD